MAAQDLRQLPGAEIVRSMLESGRVEPQRLLARFAGIEAELYRFPAVDPAGLRAAVESLSG